MFYQSVASTGNDFIPMVGQSVILPDSAQQASLPVTIVGDTVAELNESLIVTLTNVELVDPPMFIEGETSTGPILGGITESTLVILENDDPRGQFVLAAAGGNAEVHEVEPDSSTLGISLTVTRERGSIGQVSVTWSVSGGTAEEGQDFLGIILKQCKISIVTSVVLVITNQLTDKVVKYGFNYSIATENLTAIYA